MSDEHQHEFVDRIVKVWSGWGYYNQRMIIYCKGCGKVTYDHYL